MTDENIQIMNTFKIIAKTKLLLLLCLTVFLGECIELNEVMADEKDDLNGGFEKSENGLPINWVMYTPNTVPDADFKIILDKNVFKEGKQSLKFDVKKTSSTGGWLSPGLTNEFIEIGKFMGEAKYKLSFWIKNNGAKFNISAGGVSAKQGDMSILIEGNETINDWKYLEYEIDVPADMWLRIQLNILQPGVFWIDEIKIEKI